MPYRSKYNHSYHTKECPFCNKEIIEKQNLEPVEGKYWWVFVNQYPILDGNLMLVSKRHVEDSSELTGAEWAELHKKIEEAKTILVKLLKVRSFNIGINIGPDSGSSVKHLHWQIVPRKSGQPVKGFVGVIADIEMVRLLPQDLKQQIVKICTTL